MTVAGLVSIAVGGASLLASQLYADNASFWVVGSPTQGCRIVVQNPVVDGGTITFVDGPYRSEADAKLAMTTISVCKR
jgi:hypothetical protein